MSARDYRRKLLHTTHLRDIPPSVTILRERHPFEGRSLSVMSAIKRRGTLLLLVVLPDGTRSLSCPRIDEIAIAASRTLEQRKTKRRYASGGKIAVASTSMR